MDSNGNSSVGTGMSGVGDDMIQCASDVNVSDGCPTAGPTGHATASDGDNEPSAEHAPLELLASLLTSVTEKDYETALKQCREILDYEPNNVTAHRFLLLISERIQLNAEQDESEDEDDESYSDEETESSSSDESSTSGGTKTSEKESDQQEDDDDDETTASSYGTDDDVASDDGHANGTSYDCEADGNLYDADVAGQAFASTSSDALLSTGQSSGEAVDRLRAKVVPGKASDEKE